MWSEDEVLPEGVHAEARADVLAARRRGRLAPALLVTGERGIGKRRFARWVAQTRWCEGGDGCGVCGGCRRVLTANHPDLEIVRRDADGSGEDGGSRFEITVDQVRGRIVAALGLHAVEGRGRVVLVEEAEDLNEEGQNALLKVLEEPPGQSAIVLVTSAEEALLDTVRSRCQEFRLQPLSDAALGALAPPGCDPERLALARGRPGVLAELMELDVVAVREALDGLLAGRSNSATFADVLQGVLQTETDQDPASRRRLLLDVLHLRLRDLVLYASGVDHERVSTPPPQENLPPAGGLLASQASLLEAAQDGRRHLPEAVSWLALGEEMRTAVGVGAVGRTAH